MRGILELVFAMKSQVPYCALLKRPIYHDAFPLNQELSELPALTLLVNNLQKQNLYHRQLKDYILELGLLNRLPYEQRE